MTIMIKQMETPEEIEGKSLVHWQAWREAYDDLLPAAFQESMTLKNVVPIVKSIQTIP